MLSKFFKQSWLVMASALAFGLLVDKYRESVYALAYARLRNFHDAEDLTQEVFIRAYQKLRFLKRYDRVLSWLYSITSNLCKDWLRARSRRPDSEFMEDHDPKLLERVSIGSQHEEQMLESLHEALDSLPDIHQQILTLYYLGGMNSREIAEFLGASPTTIRQRLSRARSLLKTQVLETVGESLQQQRLHVGFTLRVVEKLKYTKIQPVPRTSWLPWGISSAVGTILAILAFSAHLNLINPIGAPGSLPRLSDARVMKAGEIPVDILDISQTSILSNQKSSQNGASLESLNPQNSPLMSSQFRGGEWRKVTDIPTARYGLSACSIDGKIYAVGGLDDASKVFSTLEEYDLSTKKWTRKAGMPTARLFLSTSVVNGKIYAMGGLTPYGPMGWAALSDVEEYDPAANRWTRKARMPTARATLSTSTVDGKIYAIGGVGGDLSQAIPTVEVYDPTTNRWSKRADIPTARSGLATSVVDGKIYAIGGQTGFFGPQPRECLSTVEEYDPATDTWAEKARMPTARALLSTSVLNGRIYAAGGVQRTGGDVPISTVEEYDPVADEWTRKPDMLGIRFGLSAVTMDGMVYAVGGSNDGLTFSLVSAVEAYAPGDLDTAPSD